MSGTRIIEMLNTATEENVWRKNNRDALWDVIKVTTMRLRLNDLLGYH